jgi:hypothetical protein
MILSKLEHLVLVATLALLTTASVAHADYLLCAETGEAPEDESQPWQVICAGEEAAYADVHITPSESGGTLAVHVTDHFTCEGETHMECGVASSLFGDPACLTELDSFETEYEGWIGNAVVYCGCYSPGVTCLGSE